jgi:hypothetical protein
MTPPPPPKDMPNLPSGLPLWFSDLNFICISYAPRAMCAVIILGKPIPVATWSKAWVCSHLLASIVGSNPTGAWLSVSCECCVLSGRGLCVGLITRAEESYRVWCLTKCDCEVLIVKRPWPTRGCCAMGGGGDNIRQ